MKKNILIYGVLALLILTWGYSLFFVPTFDFDESLYRRIADEMKLSHEWWKPTLDHRPLNHKPPILYWLMIGASYLFDQAGTVLSSAAAKFPSLLSSLGILIGLFFSAEYLWQKKLNFEEKSAAPLLFLSALFPVATATSAIFDPLQTFLLLPTLIIPFKYFLQDFEKSKKLSILEWMLLSLSLFFATAVKGLNGIVVPSFAFALHLLCIFIFQAQHRKNAFKAGLQFLICAFLPAAFACTLYFLFLDHEMGRAFTEEFFWVHHFARSTAAMETHSGSFLYHPIAAFMGGSFLSAFLFIQFFKTKIHYLTEGFAFTYFLAFMIVFGFTATKLPHYTWPIWPALALGGSVFVLKNNELTTPSKKHRLSKWIGSLPILIIAVVFLTLMLNPFQKILQQIESIQLGTMFADFDGIHGIPYYFVCAGFAVSFIFHVYRNLLSAKPAVLAIANLFITFALSISVIPVAVSVLVAPSTELASLAAEKYLKPGDCLRITSSHSPTVSLALGHVFLHNRCEPSEATHLITSEWKLKECDEHGFSILEKRSYLYLCGRKP